MTVPAVAGEKAAKSIGNNPKVAKQLPKKAPVSRGDESPTRRENSAPANGPKRGQVTRRGNKKTVGRVERFSNSWAPRIRPARSVVQYRHIIAAEVIIGSIIILTQDAPDDADLQFSKTITQEAYFLLAMFMLAILTSAGASAARFSAALGGVILLTLMLNQKSLLTRFLAKATPNAPAENDKPTESVGGQGFDGSTAQNNLVYGGPATYTPSAPFNPYFNQGLKNQSNDE